MQNASSKVTLCSHTAEHSSLQIHRTIVAATNGIGNDKTVTDWNTCAKSTDCNWAKSLAYYTFQSNTRLTYHRVSATVAWSPPAKYKKTFQFVTVKWKFHFTVTNLKNGQKMGKFYEMAKCVFSSPAHLKNGQSGNPVFNHCNQALQQEQCTFMKQIMTT